MKMRAAISAAILALTLCMPSVSLASDTTISIVKFFNGGARVQRAFVEAVQKVEVADPSLNGLMDWTIGHFDAQEVEKLLATLLDKKLDQSDVAAWSTYLTSHSGTDAAKIFREQRSPEAVNAAISRLPSKERNETLQFLNSSAAQKAANTFNSSEAGQLATEYGERISCGFYAHSKSNLLPKIKQAGKCLDY
jgi:hypothetical protein